MRALKNGIFLFFLFLLSIQTSAAKKTDYIFKQISLQEGLSQSAVKCIYRDHKGLIWVGTRNGLNCFDGYDLKQYFNHPDLPFSLPDNQILFITEDQENNLWVATTNGLVQYNREEDYFIPFLTDGPKFIARSYQLLPEGIVFGGKQVLYLYHYKTKERKKLPLQYTGTFSSPFSKMLLATPTVLFLGTRLDGLWTYNLENHFLEKADFYPAHSVMAMTMDSLKRIWIAPYAQGVYCFSPDGTLYDRLSIHSGLNNHVVLDLMEKDNKLWIGTDGGGINVLDHRDHSFSYIEHIGGNPSSLPVNTITCFYRDRQNTLWVGTFRGGVLRMKETYIRTYPDVPFGNPWGLSDKTVLCLYEDSQKKLWIGTDGGGINQLDPETGRFKHFPATNGTKVASIIEWSPEKLLVSNFGKGVYLFDKRSGQLHPFNIINPQANASIVSKGITINLQATPGKIFFYGEKIYVYDRQKNSFSTVHSDEPITHQSSLKVISATDTLTYLFRQNDIFSFCNKRNEFKLFHTSVKKEEILAACQDKKGNFWIGTASGLYRFTPSTGLEQAIPTQLFHAVTSLIADTNDRLWIGAQNMLFCYLIRENKFIIFGESDGIQPNEFLSKPTLLSSEGDIFMGGVAGLAQINHHIRLEDSSQPEMELAGISLDGKPVKQNFSPTGQHIRIPWNHSSIQIKASVNEKEFFREKRYRYRINELNDNYVETSDRMFPLGTLPVGNYTVSVQCNTRNGAWTLPIPLLHIEVTPPWWRTIWFGLICCILLIMGIFVAFLIYSQKKENRYKWQLKEHEQKIYEQKVQFLINISHELRTPLTLIYAPLKRILDNMSDTHNLKNELTGVFKQTRQMKNIINMVLDIRKMELGKNSLQITYHPHIEEWIKNISEDFRNEFNNKNIRLDYHFQADLPPVSFDESKCEIILSNLLMNALKFSSPDSTVTITLTADEEYVKIAISDQGIGLQNTDPGKLFSRFYQGNHNRGGSGIGLSYSKLLVELHNGQIGAQNNRQSGATFWFTLPLRTSYIKTPATQQPSLNELLSSTQKEEPAIASFPSKEYSLLIVEDEPELQKFLRISLKENFKHISTASNGEEALSVIFKEQPDLIVSDVMMPRMDGYELCQKIKNDLTVSHIPVILLTARTDSESTALGYKTGADVYIAKPFEIDFLYTIICNQLRNREAIKQKYRTENHLLTPANATFSNADENFLTRINTFIEQEISNPQLNAALLTNKMAVSRSVLYSKMKALTDMGVNDYISLSRLKTAAHLLKTTSLSILEISEQTGFTNSKYFSTLFRQQYNMPPTTYRNSEKSPSASVNGLFKVQTDQT